MYFEIYRKGNLIKRGNDILNDLSFDNELMYVPTISIDLPITYHDYITGRDEIKIFVNDKVFWGIVDGLEEDKDEEILSVDISHVVNEWTYRQISVNNAIKDDNINVVFKGSVINSGGGENISASPFDILITEFDMSLAKYVARSAAVGWDSYGNPIPIEAVDHGKLEKKSGTYKVKFFLASGLSVEVDAHVKRIEGTTSYTKDGITIATVPFEMTVSEVGTFTNADYIKRAYAMAWNDKGKDLDFTKVDHSKVKAKVGAYKVKFSVGDVSHSVKVNVKKNGSTIHTPDTDIKNANVKDPSIIDQLNDIYADMNFAYPGWKMNFSDEAKNTTIDYVYSRQDKLEALTKTMELTDDLFWRVRFVDEKVIDVSDFGDKKEWIISLKPSGANNIRLIEEPKIEHDFENVINVATVYSEKSDSGMSSLTMREIYNDESLQKDKFPCVILRANVNNERDYTRYVEQYPKLAPNNELEYAVIDEESVALEGGMLIEGTFAFNDLSPFAKDIDYKTKEIKDSDRIKAAKVAYKAAIRKLIQARRSYKLVLTTEELPADLAPGDKVRFIYDNSLYIMESCTAYEKKILSYNDWFYVTKIHYEIGNGGTEVNEITLEKYLRLDRDGSNQ